jgi:hypothetical protein
MRRLTALAALVATIACLLVGVAAAQRVQIAVDAAATPTVAQGIDDEALLAAIASTLVGKLGLPLSSPVYAYFYDSEETFEQGLVRDAGANPVTVRDHVRFATGVGSAKGIFIRRDKLPKESVVLRAGLFAHELTHVAQAALSGGRRVVAEQWLREGHADWVKYQVLERLGLQSYARSRLVQVREIRRGGGTLTELPTLTLLSSSRIWVDTRDTQGKSATYAQAFFATEYLIDLRGADAIAAYFRRDQRARDRDAAFEAAFGMPLQEFAADFARRLPELVDRKPQGVSTGGR